MRPETHKRANENDDIFLFLLLHIYSILEPMKMTTFAFSSCFIFTLFSSQWKWRHLPFPPASYLLYSPANDNDDICLFLLLHIYSILQPMKMTTFSFSSFFIFTLFSSPHWQDHTHHLWDIVPLKNKKASHSVKFSCIAIVFPFKKI